MHIIKFPRIQSIFLAGFESWVSGFQLSVSLTEVHNFLTIILEYR
jgi:hypothetical protein